MLTWKRLLFELINEAEPIRVSVIAERLKRAPGEISSRMNTLRGWGYIKYAERERKGYGGFVVTEWGRECAERWQKEGVDAQD